MSRVLICGDRNWTNIESIRNAVAQFKPTLIIEGEAKGADTLGRMVAEELNIPTMRFPAEWGRYGKSAGPIRNQQMLDEGKPTLVLAFHSDIEKSKGTKDMVARATKACIASIVFTR